jgi:hypothetical protein
MLPLQQKEWREMTGTVGTSGPVRRVVKGKSIAMPTARREDGVIPVTWILTLACGHTLTVKTLDRVVSRPNRARCPQCIEGPSEQGDSHAEG